MVIRIERLTSGQWKYKITVTYNSLSNQSFGNNVESLFDNALTYAFSTIARNVRFAAEGNS